MSTLFLRVVVDVVASIFCTKKQFLGKPLPVFGLMLLLLMLLLHVGIFTVTVSLCVESPCLVLPWNLFLVRPVNTSSFHYRCILCLRLMTAAIENTVLSMSRSALVYSGGVLLT